jgi:hypothetical protein
MPLLSIIALKTDSSPSMLTCSTLQCRIHANFEKFNPDSRLFSIRPVNSKQASKHFLPEENRGRHHEHKHTRENEHSHHFRPCEDCIVGSMDVIREEAFEIRCLVLLDVLHIFLSSFGGRIGSVLLND